MKTKVIFALSIVAAPVVNSIPATCNGFYATHIGRFTTRDPYGDIVRNGTEAPPDVDPKLRNNIRNRFGHTPEYNDGMNLYIYVKSQPITNVDPVGLAHYDLGTGDITPGWGAIHKLPPPPPGFLDCVANCVEQHTWTNAGTAAFTCGNAGLNKCYGVYPRSGIGGPRPGGGTGGPGSPSTWQHRLGMGTKCSRCANWAGNICIVYTVAEGFCDIGAELACGAICAGCYPGVDKNDWVQ